MNVHGSPPSPAGPRLSCPDCRAPLAAQPRSCRRCGLLLVGATAQRLWHIDTEIALLNSRERHLREERAAVVALLREESGRGASPAGAVPESADGERPWAPGPQGRPPGPARVPGQAPGAAPEPAVLPGGALPDGHGAHAHGQTGGAPPGRAPGEVTRRSAQNVILGLGGVLVGIAALVFAIWTWSDMGTGARAGVLGLTTAAFAALALPLHRRGLRATAETFGCLAAALLCVDALALWLLTSERLGSGPGYTATALLVIGALLASYPLLVPLRTPRVLAVLLLQPVPVLLLAASGSPGLWSWALPVLAATGLADLLLALWFGRPRAGVPVRALRVSATVLWVLTTVLALLYTAFVLAASAAGTDHVGARWFVAAVLLLSGVTGLLSARGPLRHVPEGPGPVGAVSGAAGPGAPGGTGASGVPAAIALLVLGAAPLVAGPAHLPALPRAPLPPWNGGPPTTPVSDVLGLPATTAPDAGFHLLAVLVCALLSLGAVFLLRRRALVPAAALTAPPALLTVVHLLDPPHAVAVVCALLVGAALVLATALVPRRPGAWVPALTGTLTLLTGGLWSLPDRYTSLAALVVVEATVLVALLLYARSGRPAVLHATGLLLWALALLTGAFFGLGLVISDTVPPPAWWLLAACALLAGANAVVLGRIPLPRAGGAGGDPRPVFTVVGLLLLSSAPLLAGRGHSPGLPLLSGAYGPWTAPVRALGDPAYSVLGLHRVAGPAEAVGTAAGMLLAGAAAVALVALLDRGRTAAAAVLAAPPALVALPLVLDAPFLGALLWVFAVGSALALWSALTRDGRLGWLAGLTGLLTLLLGTGWALVQEHATTGALMGVAVAAAVAAALARTTVAAVGATAVATAATGGFALALPLLLGAPVEHAALAPIAMVAAVAVAAPRLRGPLVPAAEVPAWVWAAVSLGVTAAAGARLGLVALALAVVGVVALATAARPERRWFALVGALLMLAALWTVLSAWDVAVPEAYTVPPALAALAVGWEWSRRAAEPPSSWAAHGGGLALLFLPTVVLVLTEDGMVWRVPAVLVLGLTVTVWGLRRRLQAALVTGGLVLVATSLRAFGPPLWDLTRLVPNWVPFAVAGVLLLVIGARYEANLERVRRLGRLVAEMR
ncbi:SCO7613 C-terminal domain-containing membrane protein [Nocardiopsis dassonvillei]|uniref:SCO7613 C-terminal domain-containing membrane protein n=1 Tax=Nocardiopsis dassonvillei TaxID=2014 RepID=UPI00366B965F